MTSKLKILGDEMLGRRYVVNVMKMLLCNLMDAKVYRGKKRY